MHFLTLNMHWIEKTLKKKSSHALQQRHCDKEQQDCFKNGQNINNFKIKTNPFY